MYKVIIKCKENKEFYIEVEYFKSRKESRHYIKCEKDADKDCLCHMEYIIPIK